MDWSDAIKLVHVVLGFTLVTGLIGRWSLERRAGSASDPETAFALSQASSPFERLVLISGPAIILAGLATAWVKGYPYLGLTTGWMLLSLALVLVFPFVLAPLVYIPCTKAIDSAMTEAREKGVFTQELRAAFKSRALLSARWYEAVAMTLVIALMVLKPF
ncbi:MAG: DUF2269 family protein [Candidatus Limnocylindrales bacterium]